MKISVSVKTNKKKASFKEVGPAVYEADLTSPAQDNKANQQLIRIVADHYGVSASRVAIVSGKTYKKKVLEIR